MIAQGQLSIFLSASRSDVDKVLEKIEVVHAIKSGGNKVKVVIYNYGSIPTCIVEAHYIEGALKATPTCNIIQPLTMATIELTFGGSLPNDDFYIILITKNYNIVSAEVVVP